jgi:sodium pump decarboxylase gamma subunit
MTDNLMESLVLLVVGMGGVFAALLFLAWMISMFRWADEWLNRRKIDSYARQVEKDAGTEEGANDEVVAVLTAAAATILRKRVIVRRMRFLHEDEDSPWAITGRLNIMASHAIATRKSRT